MKLGKIYTDQHEKKQRANNHKGFDANEFEYMIFNKGGYAVYARYTQTFQKHVGFLYDNAIK